MVLSLNCRKLQGLLQDPLINHKRVTHHRPVIRPRQSSHKIRMQLLQSIRIQISNPLSSNTPTQTILPPLPKQPLHLPRTSSINATNVSAPNTYLMLKRTYEAIQRAIESKSKIVMPEHIFKEETEVEIPTPLEYQILKELSKGRLIPTDVAGRLDKTSSSIVRSLKGMMNKNWVTRVGVRKRAYYSLTARGDAAIRRYGKSR